MYFAHVFGSFSHHSASGETPEAALKALGDMLDESFTYRPSDMTVYRQWTHIPCGAITQRDPIK